MAERTTESPLARLNTLFSRLGTNPEHNIALIVEATGDMLQGACALFNRLDHEDMSLCTWSAANAPDDLPERDAPEGHICFEATIKGQDKAVVIPDIRETKYASTDVNVAKYGLRSYLGYPVRLQGRAVGALCVVDLKPRDFSEDEVDLISTLAKAVSLEEERRHIGQQYRNTQEIVGQMQRLATIGGWEMDPDTLVVTSTDELNRILDLPHGETVTDADTLLDMCLNREDRSMAMTQLNKVRSGQAPQTVEMPIRTPAGAVKWVRVTGQAFFADGRPVKILGSLQDITAYKEIESSLSEAKEAAEQASRAKTQFLANMSHEVRTPLNGVLGMLQLALRTELTEEQAEYLEVGLHSCRGLLTVINDLLDLSKIEAGKITLSDEPLKLADIIASVCRGFHHQLLDQGVKLSYSVDSRIPENLRGDAGRLRQILFNLVGNAVKFTSAGSIRLDVSPISRTRETARILFSIQDTGVGIPDEALERIFEPFEQIDVPLKQKMHGTGLGLGIVRRLVELMGGTLSIESEPGKGTTVHVSVPLRTCIEETMGIPMPSGDTSDRLRILMVEDNPVNLAAPKRFLEKLGNIVDAAENGRLALRAARATRYDAVFMDLEMPELDGISATRAIRESTDFATGADTPIIALTAYAFEGDRKRCLDAGMDAFLPKPVDFKELQQVLTTIRKNARR